MSFVITLSMVLDGRQPLLLKLPGLDCLGRLRFPKNIADKAVRSVHRSWQVSFRSRRTTSRKVTVADRFTLAQGSAMSGRCLVQDRYQYFSRSPYRPFRRSRANTAARPQTAANAGENALHVVVFLIIPSSLSRFSAVPSNVSCETSGRCVPRVTANPHSRDGELLFRNGCWPFFRLPSSVCLDRPHSEDPLDRRIIPKIRGGGWRPRRQNDRDTERDI